MTFEMENAFWVTVLFHLGALRTYGEISLSNPLIFFFFVQDL